MTKFALLLMLVDLPSWMSGTWRSVTPKGTSEETWTAADGTMMTGMHRDIRSGKKTWFEFLRIEQRGESLVYIAMPGGGTPTEFSSTKIEPSRITFENPQHDFPKRIRYWLDGDKLCARVDGGDDKGQQWCWDRVR